MNAGYVLMVLLLTFTILCGTINLVLDFNGKEKQKG
jgi:hypothetical protein